jgi:hypothetical protein
MNIEIHGERFWAKVRTGEHGCWVWLAYRDPKGYGKFGVGRKTTYLAHRFSWMLANGPIQDDLCVLHRCDNPPCVRPSHLFLGTRGDNATDMALKDRRKGLRTVWGSKDGSAKLTEDDVLIIRERVRSGETQTAVALDYGVTQANVSEIIRRKTWTHI